MKKVLATLLLLAPLSVGASTTKGPEIAQINTGAQVEVNVRSDEARSDKSSEDSDSNEESGTASSTVYSHAQNDSEEHQKSVAAFVHSLLSVADRDNGIGAEVRAVAQSQLDSASSTEEAKAKVENHSKLMSFLFGTDWKNLGAVRSASAKGTADMHRLETALEKTKNASVRTELKAQIQVLKEQQIELDHFVTEHESSFSLFGWFTKLFVKSEV